MLTPIDFAYWDTLDEFTLHQVAWLWEGVYNPPSQPSHYLPKDRRPIEPLVSEIGREIGELLQGVVKTRIDNAPPDEPSACLLHRAYRFTRNELREYAVNISSYRPLFLFPENRPGQTTTAAKLPSRAVQPVYQIIAALWTMYYGVPPTDNDLEALIKDFEVCAETHKLSIPGTRTIEGHIKKAFNLV